MISILPVNELAEQLLSKEELEIYRQIRYGDICSSVNRYAQYVEDSVNDGSKEVFSKKEEKNFEDRIKDTLEDEDIQSCFETMIRVKLIQSLRLYATSWSWPMNKRSTTSTTLTLSNYPENPVFPNLKPLPSVRPSPLELIKQEPKLSEYMFPLPSDECSLLLENVKYSKDDITFHRKSIDFYKTTTDKKIIIPLAILPETNKKLFFSKLSAACNVIRQNTIGMVGMVGNKESVLQQVLNSTSSIEELFSVVVEKALETSAARDADAAASTTNTSTTTDSTTDTATATNNKPTSNKINLNEQDIQDILNEIKLNQGNNKKKTDKFLVKERDENDILNNQDFKQKSTFDKFKEVVDSMIDADSTSIVAPPKSTADGLIRTYFDETSLVKGDAVSRLGAGLFQSDILKGILDVSNANSISGAYVFDGRAITKNSRQFAEILNQRFLNSSFAQDLNYIITTNRNYASPNETITEQVYSFMGEYTTVIIFPKQWNSTSVPTPEAIKYHGIMKSLNVISSVLVASECYQLFNPETSVFLKSGGQTFPEGFFELAILPILLQVIPVIIESVVGLQKGVNVTSVQIPAWITLPTFGYRSFYMNRPKTRNDMFDMAFIGWLSSFALSFITAIIGLKWTAGASQEVLATYPSVSLFLLQLNPIVKQVLGSVFPETITQTVTYASDTQLHLHWYAIAGLWSLIVNSLQLVPTAQSIGSRMLYSFYGIYWYSIVQQVVSLFRGIFNITWVISSFSFTENILSITSRSALLFTFFISEIQGFLPDVRTHL